MQRIELNRGCKRGCPYCHADRNFQEFHMPEITKKLVLIIEEGILYDSRLPELFDQLGAKGRRIGLSSGIDRRLLTQEIAEAMHRNHIGIINNKGKWYNGAWISWDGGLDQQQDVKDAIDILLKAGFTRKHLGVFVLVNWLVPYDVCEEKRKKLFEWGVKIGDCTYDCTKKNFIPQHWSTKDYKTFRRVCRQHNIAVNFSKDKRKP